MQDIMDAGQDECRTCMVGCRIKDMKDVREGHRKGMMQERIDAVHD